MSIRVEVDLRKIDKAIKAATKAGADLRPAFKVLRAPLKKSQREHIRNMKGGDGSKFKKLAPSTIARRLSRGGKEKKFTKKGKMRKTASRKLGRILSKKLVSKARVKVTKRSISMFARGGVAHALHGGAKVGRGRRSRLPARPFMYVDNELADLAFDRVSRHVAESFQSARVKK